MSDCIFEIGCNKKDCSKSFCERKYRLENLFNKSLLTAQQQKHIDLIVDKDLTDLEAFKYLAEVSKNIEQFVNSGSNLFIYSKAYGNGKTSWSIKLLESYLYKVWFKVDLSCHALFVNVPRFLQALKADMTERNEYAHAVLDNVLVADLVVWDDFSHHFSSDYEISQLLQFIDTRINMGKANIYTSNISPTELSKYIGERLTSRVANLSTKVQFNGSDKRGINYNDGTSSNT